MIFTTIKILLIKKLIFVDGRPRKVGLETDVTGAVLDGTGRITQKNICWWVTGKLSEWFLSFADLNILLYIVTKFCVLLVLFHCHCHVYQILAWLPFWVLSQTSFECFFLWFLSNKNFLFFFKWTFHHTWERIWETFRFLEDLKDFFWKAKRDNKITPSYAILLIIYQIQVLG